MEKENSFKNLINVMEDFEQVIKSTTNTVEDFHDIYYNSLPAEFVCNKSRSQCNHCGKCSSKSRKYVGLNKGRKKKRR